MLLQTPAAFNEEAAPQDDHDNRHSAPQLLRAGLYGQLLQSAAALQTEVHAGGEDARDDGSDDTLLEIELGDRLALLLFRHFVFLGFAREPHKHDTHERADDAA